jgi:hypothetical protein
MDFETKEESLGEGPSEREETAPGYQVPYQTTVVQPFRATISSISQPNLRVSPVSPLRRSKPDRLLATQVRAGHEEFNYHNNLEYDLPEETIPY